MKNHFLCFKSWSSTLSEQTINWQINPRDKLILIIRRKQGPWELRGLFLVLFYYRLRSRPPGRTRAPDVSARACGSPWRYWVCLLCVPTRVRRHLLRPPPNALAAEAQAYGLRRGKSLRRRFKLFFSAGDRASVALGCGFGRERPKPELGKPGGAEAAVRTQMAPPRARNTLPRPQPPEQLFPAIVAPKFPPLLLCERRRASQPESQAFRRRVLRPSPARRG